MALESTPDDRKRPNGLSATVRMRIAASSVGSQGSGDGSGRQYSMVDALPRIEVVAQVMRGS